MKVTYTLKHLSNYDAILSFKDEGERLEYVRTLDSKQGTSAYFVAEVKVGEQNSIAERVEFNLLCKKQMETIGRVVPKSFKLVRNKAVFTF